MANPYAVVDDEEKGFVGEQADAPGASSYTYMYDKLPPGSHFRLLQLLPGDGGRFECQMATYPLDCPDTTHRIVHSHTAGRTPDSTVWSSTEPASRKTTPSAHSTSYATRYGCRATFTPVTLWVDALCINQADLDERASQVLLLQRVYHNADEVCMWLGTKDASSPSASSGEACTRLDILNAPGRLAFRLLRTLEAKSHMSSSRHITRESPYSAKSMDRQGLPHFPSKHWEALVNLFARPYSRRIWIVEEIIATPLAAPLYCGDLDPICWTTLTAAVAFLSRVGWHPVIESYYGGQNHLSFILTTVLIGMAWLQGATTMVDRLLIRRKAQVTRRFEATDPRDKVFALIGIANDFGHRDLLGEDNPKDGRYPYWAWSAAGWTMPTYNRPVEHVYTEYTAECILDDGVLDILSHVEDPSLRVMPDLPSWAPDFSVPMTITPLASWKTHANEGFYSATCRTFNNLLYRKTAPSWAG
ncbi:hypothetical protein N657DRAFT_677257 [Parathielavia appendiculata]|uniref:Heterokaryon incompatibility domain-containing protein n=1 Tax=Parathielavia appendiculata TaxID=2587402 RepID=A0AAN6UBL7_9PEZI|nr:hypothetical protein N657DRAFT_677257 [Parathielavia appendiculata]